MKTNNIIFFLLLLVACQSNAFAQNLLQNGDFEAGFSNWSVAGKVNLSENFAFSGERAVEFDTEIFDYGYVYQKLFIPTTAFETVFWICPKSQVFYSIFELVADWSASNSYNTKFIARIEFKQDVIKFTALDVDTTINDILESNYWNKIAICTDEYGWSKTFFINDQLVCKLTPSYFMPVETLIFGDVCSTDDYGWLFYDNISIISSSLINFPKYSQRPLDIIYCDSFQPERTLTFHVNGYQNVSAIKLVYGYVNFDQIGGDYPQTDPGTVSFCVKIGDEIIDEVVEAKNNFRIKREIEVLPYWNKFSDLEITFSYQGGNNGVEIVRPVLSIIPATGTNSEPIVLSSIESSLYQNYPNPFNPVTTIAYEIDKPGDAVLTIFNSAGQQVKKLVDRYHAVGNYSVLWDGTGQQGERCSSGSYFYQLRSGKDIFYKSMVYLK